jgi:hypothetical protein
MSQQQFVHQHAIVDSSKMQHGWREMAAVAASSRLLITISSGPSNQAFSENFAVVLCGGRMKTQQ